MRVVDIRQRLAPTTLAPVVEELRFRPDDGRDLLAAAEKALSDAAASTSVQLLADRLVEAIGRIAGGPDAPQGEDGTWAPLSVPEAEDTTYGVGVLPLLALVATVPELLDYHRSRGISAEVSADTLAEVAQQVWVHRLTFDEFGVHTYGWLQLLWSGALYWLGRLQFNLQWEAAGAQGAEGAWMISTHIPRSGPLTPEAVDDSFARAADFFAKHFEDYPVTGFHCFSWLLDPLLAADLPQTSNMAQFQRRWTLYGAAVPGDEDAVFFTFARRQPVDLDTLPQETTLQRAIVHRLQTGGHWQLWHGRIGLETAAASQAGDRG